MAKYKDRREQRKVTETMNTLLLPLLPFFNSETANVIKRALYLLGEIEIEPQQADKERMNEAICVDMGKKSLCQRNE